MVERQQRHNQDVSKLLHDFYEEKDEENAARIAERILDEIQPQLRKWAYKMNVSAVQGMWDREDFYSEVCLTLWRELRKSRDGERIESFFGYARSVALRVYLQLLRKKRQELNRINDPQEADYGTHRAVDKLIDVLSDQHVCRTGWNLLKSYSLRVRKVIALALECSQVQMCVERPDPVPEFAAMIEMPESEVWALWRQLPLDDERIADLLETTKGSVQVMRSVARKKLYQAVCGEKR